MPEATIAYETYGRLAPDGRNAMLITHGYTGSHHAAGRNPANGNQPGSWDGLIGPGKAIDTDKLFVVATNMLGSSFGSTNAASINPATGKPYGPDFPAITIARHRRRAESAAAIRSASGIWSRSPVRPMAATRRSNGRSPTPISWMRSCRSTPRPGPRSIPTSNWPRCRRGSRRDPEWHGGRYYGTAACKVAYLDRDPRRDTEALRHRGQPGARGVPDPTRREAAIREQAANWARNWDANSLIILRRALLGFDTRPDFARIKAKVLYILCRTDALFPPKIAPAVIEALTAAGVEARYFEIDSDLGHSSSGPEHAKWSPVLREFLAPLVARAA